MSADVGCWHFRDESELSLNSPPATEIRCELTKCGKGNESLFYTSLFLMKCNVFFINNNFNDNNFNKEHWKYKIPTGHINQDLLLILY